MPKAIWNGVVVADAAADAVQVVEGNIYFPLDSVNKNYLEPSSTHTVCPWKGTANYYSLKVAGEINRDSVWYYPEPKDAAHEIKGSVAFWRGVKVEN